MYSYISENNFGPYNQIIVPTGYKIINTAFLHKLMYLYRFQLEVR